MKGLASDNQAGVWPEIMQALAACNEGHAQPYGQDTYSEAAAKQICETLGAKSAHFVFNGTAANVLAIGALLERHEAIICADSAHLHVDECGAPERVLGAKLLITPTVNGKLTPAAIEAHVIRRGDQHFSQPRVVSLAQPTEYGTVYTVAELAAIADVCKRHGLKLHIDGARFANAAAALDVTLRDLCRGVDALSLGGTKAGLMFGEAVVLFGEAPNFRYLRKQAMQLGSKGRFLGAQFQTYLRGWKPHAQHSNAMAKRLAEAVRDVVEITQPVEANAVFAKVPKAAIRPLMDHTHFYVWNEHTHEVRWRTSWDTAAEEIDAFAATLRQLCPRP